jgi:hypothetical protein
MQIFAQIKGIDANEKKMGIRIKNLLDKSILRKDIVKIIMDNE